ncbi:MAG: Fe-S-containing protein, partial [Pauljensenia sp.]
RAQSSTETPVPGDTLVRLVGALFIAFALFRSVPTALNQAVMMLSGGVEIYSTQAVLAIVGYGLAWVLVCFLAWVSYRLCAWNNRVWPAACILCSLVLNHSLLFVRILKAKRWVTVSKGAWNTISWFINNEAVFTIVAALALGVVVALTWHASRSIPTVGANPAEGRLGRARSRLYKSMAGTAAVGYLCGALLITVGVAIGSQEVELSAPEAHSVVDDQVSVNLADISDGHLHRFEYTTSTGVKVRFIVIQKSGSSFGVGLDACEICGPTGYYEKDGKVICKLCEVAMNIATIGFKGGCNPIPIEYKVSNGTLTVPISVLEASAPIFAK